MFMTSGVQDMHIFGGRGRDHYSVYHIRRELRSREGRTFWLKEQHVQRLWDEKEHNALSSCKKARCTERRGQKKRCCEMSREMSEWAKWYRALLATLRTLVSILTAMGTHWRPSSIGSDKMRLILLEYHSSFSVKNGLELPRMGVERNFMPIPGKYLRTYFDNSRHLMWPAV